MTMYKLPEEPAGPVWDKDGTKWFRMDSGEGWTMGPFEYQWYELLDECGPLTDVPPVKVGDTITLEKFRDLPVGSVARPANGLPIAYIRAHGRSVLWTGDNPQMGRNNGLVIEHGNLESHELIVLYIKGES